MNKTTFKATSNDVAPTAVDTSGRVGVTLVTLEEAIQVNRAFGAAFGKDQPDEYEYDEYDELEEYDEYDHPKKSKTEEGRPIIIQSSTNPAAGDDRIAASVSIMSTLQAYLEYCFELSCGIPEVTLEGTTEDWQKLRQKLDRLLDYDLGEEKLMTQWYNLLFPVVDEMVASVQGKPSLEFWDKICHHHGGGSGPRFLSGWVTVFACFTKEGKWQGQVPFDTPHHQFGFSHDGREYVDQGKPSPFKYPFINTNHLPIGAATVPVLVDDNGVQYDTQMLAGQVAYEAVDYKKSGQSDTIRPRNDWCIAYTGKPKADPRPYKHGEIRQT